MAKRKNIIPYETVGRLLEASGAERVSHEAKVAVAEHLEMLALEIGKAAAKYASHAGRATITDKDIKLAEKSLYSG